MAMGIDGLISGLNTTDLINQLMQVEAAPQTALKTKQSETNKLITALQALNSKVASLKDAAAKAADAESWTTYTATSSSDSVTVSADASALPSTLSFTVDSLASRQVSLTDPFTDLTDLVPPGSPLTITRDDGTTTEITPDGDGVTDLVKAINAADAGVKAVVVNVGGQQRLQLTGTETGATHGFQVSVGSVADGTATPLALTDTSTAQDAVVTLWPGSGAAQQVTSASNTFSDVLDGVTFTVSKVTSDPVELTVDVDTAAVAKLGTDLIDNLNLVLSEIGSQTASTTSTGDDGREVVTGGVLSGDFAVRMLQQDLMAAGSLPVDGRSPADIGISLGKDGSFSIDQDAFAEAYAADPQKVQAMLSTIAQRVADVADAASNKDTGTLTTKITSAQDQVKDLGQQISDWDDRLALRREGLQAVYAQLEVALSNMQSQQSWLSGQLASLPSMSS